MSLQQGIPSTLPCRRDRKRLAGSSVLQLSCLVQVWLGYTFGTGFIILISIGKKRMAPSTPRRVSFSLCIIFLECRRQCWIGAHSASLRRCKCMYTFKLIMSGSQLQQQSTASLSLSQKSCFCRI